MQVLQNRFQLTSQDPRQYAPLRDLAVGVFSFLPHTPVTALGINRNFHFKMRSAGTWHAIGHLLAPKEPWTPIVETPGLRSMLIQGRRKDANGGVLHVKVEPSLLVEHGLYLEVNEEFKVTTEKKEPEGAQWVPERLVEQWDDILKFAEISARNIS